MELATSSGFQRSSRRFASSCPPRIPDHQPHDPWLVISHGKHMQRQTFFSISQDRYHVRTIPELRSKTIWARCDQWLVLCDLNSSECSLFNLLSMETIQLPTIKPHRHSLCVLSSPPGHSNCCVVFLDRVYRSETESCLHFWKHGEEKFDKQEFSMGNDLWASATTFKGKIYALTLIRSRLFMFDFSGPKPLKTPVAGEEQEPAPYIPYDSAPTWLVESMGELLLIKSLKYAEEVHGFIIKRYNFQENSWDEVKSLGKTRALFLGKNWGMSCSATSSKVEGNSIYFTFPCYFFEDDADRCLYVFDLEKQMISYSLPCPDVIRGRRSQFHDVVRGHRSQFHWITIPEYCENYKSLIPMTKFEPCKQGCCTMKERRMEPSYRSWSEVVVPSNEQSLILSRHASMESSDRSWSELLPDMLSLILSRLFAGDSVIFNMVCRSWRSITQVRALPDPPVDSLLSYSPCLVTLNNRVCEFYHPVYNATYKIETPQVYGARIRASGYGWLLMSKEESKYFFNPFTKEKIDLPYSPPACTLNYLSRMNFSSPPTSPDCLVIGAMCTFNQAAVVMTIGRGEVEWTLHTFVIPFHKKFIRCNNCSPVFSNGKCYFLGETGNIGVFDAKDSSLDIRGKAWSARERDLIRPSSMVEDKEDGALLAVFLTHEHRYVQIRKFDLSKMIWENVERLGSDKMLYVSDGTSYLETSVARGMGNKIYFPKFYGGEKVGVFYCLSTKKYQSFDGKYSNKSPFKLFEPRPCAWIKPVYTESVVEDRQQLKW